MKFLTSKTFKVAVLLLFSCFILLPDIYSQDVFSEGFIVTNKKDTIQGFINVISNVHHSRACESRISLDAGSKFFNPQQIILC